jgi:hypothetical protein
MDRRSFLKLGTTSSVALTAVGITATLSGCSESLPENGSWRALRSQDRIMLTAIAPVMLKGTLPTESTAQKNAIDSMLESMDLMVFKLGPHNAKQLADLFTLLNFTATRGLTTGVWSKWENADEATIESFLNSWRESSLGLFNLGYNGLNKLINATWYGQKESWAAIGYPGPPYAEILISKKSV